MAQQRDESSQEELVFEALHKAAWDEVCQFRNSAGASEDYFGDKNPQHHLAPEFFQTYLQERPSQVAERALSNSFTMWGNLKGVSDRAQAAAEQISVEEDVWDLVVHGLFRTFCEDDRKSKGMQLLEELTDQIVPLKSRSALLCTLAETWNEDGDTDKARRAFEQIVAWDSSELHADKARGYLYELDSLNIGQEAPDFSLNDVDGRPFSLSGLRGKVVVLHFWGTGCVWCQFVYPALRRLSHEYPASSASQTTGTWMLSGRKYRRKSSLGLRCARETDGKTPPLDSTTSPLSPTSI